MAAEAQIAAQPRSPRAYTPKFTPHPTSLAAFARKPLTLRERLARFWREIEPDFEFSRDSSIERWDGLGEGLATLIAFEGFGITASLFIGRMPKAVLS